MECNKNCYRPDKRLNALSMLIFQIIATMFIVFALQRVNSRYKEARIPRSEVLVWVVFWIIVAAAIWYPRGTDIIANAIGISRGYELVVAVSLALLFFLVFKLFTHVHQLQTQMTELVRKLAIQQHHDPQPSTDEQE